MRALLILVKKEILEAVRNPRFIIFTVLLPLILFPLMGYIIGQAFTSITERVSGGSIILVDRDSTEVTSYIIESLHASGLNITILNDFNLTRLPGNILGVIVFPEGFSEEFLMGRVPSLELYVVINGISISEQGIVSTLRGIVDTVKNILENYLAETHGIDPRLINTPIAANTTVYVKSIDRVMSDRELNAISMQSTFWPWLIFSMIISVVQLSAVFLGEEKEQKTMEILLSLPVRRTTILFSKVLGSGFIALLAAIFYTIGFLIYLNFYMIIFEHAGLSLELAIDHVSIILMGIIFLLALIFSASLGLSVSVIAQDTRSAESLASAVAMPTLILAFLVMFIDIGSLPLYLQVILYVYPYTYLMEGLKYLYIGRYWFFILGIFVNLAGAIILLGLVSRIFTSERILTMRVRIGGRRRE